MAPEPVPVVRILAPASDVAPVVVTVEGDAREVFDYIHGPGWADWVERIVQALKRALDDASLDLFLDEERGRGG